MWSWSGRAAVCRPPDAANRGERRLRLRGIFRLPKNYFRGKILRKNHYILSLRLQIGAWTEDCDALLLAREDGTLTGVLLSPWQVWTLSGRRTEPFAQYA